MKIAIDLTSLADNLSGMERMALNIAKELLKIDKKNKYQLYFKREIHPEFRNCQNETHVECVILPQRNKLWFYQITLLAALNRSDAEIYLFLAFPAPFFLCKKKIINTIQDMGCWDCPETMKKKMVAYFRLMYWNCAYRSWKLFTISEFSKKRILKYLKPAADKTHVLYLGVSEEMYVSISEDWEQVRNKYKLPNKYIMCLSTLEPRKNMELLVDAYCSLPDEDKKGCSLVLSGRAGWLMEHFLGRIPEMEEKGVHVTDYIEDRDLPYLYRHAEFFVFASIYEGFGIPPLEAMAVGCPVVCSDIEVSKEILKDQAVYFRNRDKESLRSVLASCLKNKEIFPSRNSLIEYSRRFSYQKTAMELKRLLESD